MVISAYTAFYVDDPVAFYVHDVFPIVPQDIIISLVKLSYMSSWFDNTNG
jgi:hypothetical protein